MAKSRAEKLPLLREEALDREVAGDGAEGQRRRPGGEAEQQEMPDQHVEEEVAQVEPGRGVPPDPGREQEAQERALAVAAPAGGAPDQPGGEDRGGEVEDVDPAARLQRVGEDLERIGAIGVQELVHTSACPRLAGWTSAFCGTMGGERLRNRQPGRPRAGRGRGGAARQGASDNRGKRHDAGVRVSGAGRPGDRHGAGPGRGLSGGAGGVRGGGRGARARSCRR